MKTGFCEFHENEIPNFFFVINYLLVVKIIKMDISIGIKIINGYSMDF